VSATPLVRLDDVSKEYELGALTVHAVRGVSFDVAAGELVIVLGPSGSGKTTILNLLGGIDSPTSGRILVDGRDIAHYDEEQLTQYRRRTTGFVFQFFNLIPTLTALENVSLVAELVPDCLDPAEMLGAVGLADRADHFPSELSGGEQQRVAIARALVKNPAILLADEPTGNLDHETAIRVLQVIRDVNANQGKAVVMVTHNNAVAAMAHKVLRMRSGELVEVRRQETPADPLSLVW